VRKGTLKRGFGAQTWLPGEGVDGALVDINNLRGRSGVDVPQPHGLVVAARRQNARARGLELAGENCLAVGQRRHVLPCAHWDVEQLGGGVRILVGLGLGGRAGSTVFFFRAAISNRFYCARIWEWIRDEKK
jgi:hypothetical protein